MGPLPNGQTPWLINEVDPINTYVRPGMIRHCRYDDAAVDMHAHGPQLHVPCPHSPWAILDAQRCKLWSIYLHGNPPKLSIHVGKLTSPIESLSMVL